MESDTSCRNDPNAPLPPINFSNISLKLEKLDHDFCIDNFSSSKSFLQDFQNLDHFPLTTSSSFNPGTTMQANGFDPFDPFCHGLSSRDHFGLYEFKPYEENGSFNFAAMQDFQGGGGFLNFSERKDSLIEIETGLHDPKPSSFFNIPDESSCVTADNLGFHKGDGSTGIFKNGIISNDSESLSTKKCGRGSKKSKSVKGQWTVEEDRLLIHLVEKYGIRKWSHIAQMLKGRIGKQCRERWHNHLRPDIKKDVWTEEEDRILIEVHAKVGNKWAEIAKSLPGRTENSIKNHWNATKRRQFSRRKCRTKWPRSSSLLQNYIKSLHIDKESKNTQPHYTTTDHGLISNNTSSIDALQNSEMEFGLDDDDQMVSEYDFDDMPEFTFHDEGDGDGDGDGDDDFVFRGSGIDSIMDDIPVGPPLEIDDEPCFDVEFPFDMPPLVQSFEVKKDFGSSDENA